MAYKAFSCVPSIISKDLYDSYSIIKMSENAIGNNDWFIYLGMNKISF